MAGVALATPEFRSRSVKRFQNCHFCVMCNPSIFFATLISYGVTLFRPTFPLCNTILNFLGPSSNSYLLLLISIPSIIEKLSNLKKLSLKS